MAIETTVADAAKVRAYREELRLSQSEVARLSGVPRLRICGYELGDGKLSTDELARVRAALEGEARRIRNLPVLDAIPGGGQAV